MDKRLKVKVNSTDKIEELLQEIYDQACKNINEIQNEINKLINNTNLADENITMDDKSKYSKSLHDFFTDKNKALSSKFEIAKFLGEMVKYNGDINSAMNDETFKKNTKLDLKSIREAINSETKSENTKIYTLK